MSASYLHTPCPGAGPGTRKWAWHTFLDGLKISVVLDINSIIHGLLETTIVTDGRTDGSIDLIGMKDGLRLASIILPFITNNFNTRSNYY